MSATSGAIGSIVVNGVTLEATERGQGRPILFLHPGIGIDANAPVLDALAKGGRVIAPTHPGFGKSDLPKGITTVDDLSYFYLDLIEQRGLRDILVVGVGLGGWIAAEMAVKSTERLSALVLGNPVGVKIGDRETRDIVDIWSLMPDELLQRAYFDPANGKRDYKTLPEEESLRAARNREATARFGWSPYMHNPKLKGRLHRINIPTLFLWGTADRIISDGYGRAYCALIPGARFQPLERAGHYPHIEQPEEFARHALVFADSGPSARAKAV
jgi:pimeloyl-ACP methyl ester carboxylesterase